MACCLNHLYVMFRFSTRIFYGGVSGFATDCHCGVWTNSWVCKFDIMENNIFIVFYYVYIYIYAHTLMSHSMAIPYFYLPYFQVSNGVLFFAKYSGTLFYIDVIFTLFIMIISFWNLIDVTSVSIYVPFYFHTFLSHCCITIFNEICIPKYTSISRQFHRIKS